MGTWKFDPYHTQVEFSAKHLGMMTVRGHFAEVTATGDIYPESPEKTTIEATINTASKSRASRNDARNRKTGWRRIGRVTNCRCSILFRLTNRLSGEFDIGKTGVVVGKLIGPDRSRSSEAD